MDIQNKEIAAALAPIFKGKDDDYFRIWDSWGMTKEEWQALEAKRVTEGA